MVPDKSYQHSIGAHGGCGTLGKSVIGMGRSPHHNSGVSISMPVGSESSSAC